MRLESLTCKGVLAFDDAVMIDLAALAPGSIVAVTGANGCLAGNTLIDVPRDLIACPKGIPIRDLVGTTPLVYGYDLTAGRIRLGRAASVRRTGTSVPTLRVSLKESAGHRAGRFLPPTELVGTPEHLVMLTSGVYKPLGDLAPGDRLMSLYRRCRDGRYAWINMGDGTFALEHRLVAAHKLGRPLGPDEHGHHQDKNTFNNAEDNIEGWPIGPHMAYHAAEHPPHYDEHPRGMLGLTHRLAVREQIAASMRARWANPIDRKRWETAPQKAAASRPKRPWHDRALLFNLYVIRTQSTVQIAEQLGTRNQVIRYWMQKYGIPRRSLRDGQLARIANHTVLSVEPAGFEDVYDIEVPGLSNFVANGVVVHNSGKTTLTETPIGATYRTMPFRDKPLVDYALGRESYLEAVWKVDTSTIRTRVNLDGVRRTTEAVVEVDGAAVTDGKVTTFDAEIERRFPPLRVVLASAFCAQNRRGSFINLSQKGRKELFGDLRGLGQFEEWAVRAKGQVTALEARRAVEQARHDEIAKLTGPDVEARLRARADALQVEVGALELRRATVTRAREALDDERPGVVADAERHAQAESELAELAADLRENEADRTRLVKARRDLVEATDREATKLGAGLQDTFARLVRRGRQAEQERDGAQTSAEARFKATEQDRKARIANNLALLAGAETLRAQAAEAERLEMVCTTLRATLRDADEHVLHAERTAGDRTKTAHRLSDAPGALKRARQDAALLASVPCGGTGPYAACSFLQRATDATTRLADLRADLDTYQEAVAQRDEAEQVYLAAKSARTAAARAAKDAEQRLAALNGVTKQLAALDVAEAKIAEHERAIQEAGDVHQRPHPEAAARFEQTITALGAEAAEARAAYDPATAATKRVHQ